jgi:hypothetical protein
MPDDAAEKDRCLRDIEQALFRASLQAEKLARETGTPLVLWQDGRVVEVWPAIDSSMPMRPGQPPQ